MFEEDNALLSDHPEDENASVSDEAEMEEEMEEEAEDEESADDEVSNHTKNPVRSYPCCNITRIV